MKCMIQRASCKDDSLCPHEDAYWDPTLKSYCIDIVSMEHLVSIMQRFPDCMYNTPEALLSIRPIDKMLLITIYDDYVE